jgi:proline racemase
MVAVTEPVTSIRLDTPAGLVVADVEVSCGRAMSVTLTNVPSFAVGYDLTVDVPGRGEVRFDLAFGGNFYAILPAAELGVAFGREHQQEMLDKALALLDAVNEQREPVHPTEPLVRGCHHVYIEAPGSDARRSRHAMAIAPGWFDRSPCGTGTSARMAQLHFKGELPLDTEFDNESFIGTHFIGRLVSTTTVGDVPAVIPTIKGRAWITGTAQYFLADDDPFPAGFLL